MAFSIPGAQSGCGKLALALLALGAWFSLAAGAAWGAQDTVLVNIQAPLVSKAALTITPSTINFPSADPDVMPSIPANENPVSVSAYAQTGNQKIVTLTVQAGGDLVSGPNTIGINNVTWTATGGGYVAGTMNKTTAQSAGQWTGGNTYNGTFSYFLANNWNYAAGSYTAQVTYTLTVP